MSGFIDLQGVVQSGSKDSGSDLATPTSANRSSAEIAKLKNAAAEFESMLLSSFWKSMKDSFTGTADDSSDPAKDSLDDWGIQAMSQAVGRAGGLGLGKLILKKLAPDLVPERANSIEPK